MGLFDKLKSKNKNHPEADSSTRLSPAVTNMVVFTENAGGCIITKSLLAGKSHLKWLFRSESVNPADNGWRAYGDIDTEEYICDPKNHVVVDFNTLANLEPLVLDVYELPVDTDLEFHFDETGRYFTDNATGNRLK